MKKIGLLVGIFNLVLGITLIHQYFIKGGNLGKQEAKAISFQNTLSWKESN